ncbi:hypothetical protein GCM10023156_61750 [Novipirellula rosea]|uniref:DNA 3'-5' helicase II n=2 Tax=Novipirellula rosea TaxID=1031540 RepID=A0ABP8NQU3_9BACT
MRSLVPDEHKEKFSIEKYVDYAKFRKLWTNRFGKEQQAVKQYGPQISWHVIRGLIKGINIDAIMERDDYDELPRDEKTITQETYELVHDRVWTAWYEAQFSSGEGWDDQDLVHFLLDEDLLPRSHVAIFCDESQDFTRVELEAIYRCSMFSNRLIATENARKIPFVFAGDPFQTLNPTGFRWESVQAAFTERIVQSLHRFDARVTTPELHYEELTLNYRSAKRIVFFCNSVQAVRALLFSHKSLRPQSTWRLEDDKNAPVFLRKEDSSIEHSLAEQLDLVLIVPCEEGEEEEYVKNDSYLSRIVKLDDDGVPMNVQSAARSKGLEFKRVALYGWSKRVEAKRISDLLQRTDSSKIKDATVDEKLGLEYFMNNLYVAASRAQRRLFIIDESASLDTIWWIVSDQDHLDRTTSKLHSDWKGNVGPMIRGDSDSFEHDKDSLSNRAQQQKSLGLAKSDYIDMKQAAALFDMDGNRIEASICSGYAYKFAARYKEAGKHFEDASKLDLAMDAFWQGKHFRELSSLAERHIDIAALPKCQIASFLIDMGSSPRQLSELLRRLLETYHASPAFASELRTTHWLEAIETTLQRVFNTKGASSLSAVDASLVADPLRELVGCGIRIDRNLLADAYFAAEEFDEVVKLLESDPGASRYREARARQILAAEGDRSLLTTSEASMVGEYLLKAGRLDEAAEFLYLARETSRTLECARLASQDRSKPNQRLSEVARFALRSLIDAGDWSTIVSFVEDGVAIVAPGKETLKKSKKSESANAIREQIEKAGLLWTLVIPAFAASDDLSRSARSEKQKVQEFLSRIVGANVWQNKVERRTMGAAIERAGRDVDALSFYEKWRDSNPDRHDRLYSDNRWVVCKLRQADQQDAEGQRDKAVAYRQDAAKVMNRHGWTESDIGEEFPQLARATSKAIETNPVPQAAHPTTSPTLDGRMRTANLGVLELKFIPSKGWVNIADDDGLQARVFLIDRKAESSDVKFASPNDNQLVCDQWKLNVEWLASGPIRFSKGDEALDLIESSFIHAADASNRLL